MLSGVVLFYIDITIWDLTFCVGFALILAAFGTTATIKYKEATVVGSGAIAIVLYILIKTWSPETKVTYAIIRGNFTPKTEIFVKDDDDLLGAFRGEREKYYKFIIEGDKLKTNNLVIDIGGDIVDKKLEIHKDNIEPFLSKGNMLDWEYDIRTNIIKDKSKEGRVISKITPDTSLVHNMNANIISPIFDIGISSVYGEGIEVPIDTLLEDLNSESLRIRRSSRSDLSQRGIDAIDPMMKKLREDYKDYRIRLGIISALVDMIKQNPTLIEDIKEKLKEEDIELLYKAAFDEDETVKISAIEILYSIGKYTDAQQQSQQHPIGAEQHQVPRRPDTSIVEPQSESPRTIEAKQEPINVQQQSEQRGRTDSVEQAEAQNLTETVQQPRLEEIASTEQQSDQEELTTEQPQIEPNYALARFYSMKNNKAVSLSYLQEAIKIDSTQKDKAKREKDFRNLWNDEEFKRLCP